MIKFFYNGLKTSDQNGLQKAHYSMGDIAGPNSITIYARDYEHFSKEVEGAFAVENDSDSMTDYFVQDRIRVAADHPLYAQVRTAWEAQEMHRGKTIARRRERRAA